MALTFEEVPLSATCNVSIVSLNLFKYGHYTISESVTHLNVLILFQSRGMLAYIHPYFGYKNDNSLVLS